MLIFRAIICITNSQHCSTANILHSTTKTVWTNRTFPSYWMYGHFLYEENINIQLRKILSFILIHFTRHELHLEKCLNCRSHQIWFGKQKDSMKWLNDYEQVPSTNTNERIWWKWFVGGLTRKTIHYNKFCSDVTLDDQSSWYDVLQFSR